MAPDTSHQSILQSAADLVRSGQEFVLITVVAAKGSTPRNPGARMIWRPTSDQQSTHGSGAPNGTIGTVGGGHFEHLVLDAARACAAKRASTFEHFVLGSDADQCCGGTMDVFLEYHGRPVRVVLFGAGHVSASLCGVLGFSSLRITVVDDRPDWNSESRFPGARCLHSWPEGVAAVRENPEGTMIIVMTCSHETDFELLRELLRTPPAFTGLIGSRSKRACLFSRLTGAGVDADAVARVECPVGVGDTGKEPAAVAISMAAQLLIKARTLAAR